MAQAGTARSRSLQSTLHACTGRAFRDRTELVLVLPPASSPDLLRAPQDKPAATQRRKTPTAVAATRTALTLTLTMAGRSLPDERCFPYAKSALANSTDNPTAPRGDDPTANEMTLSLRLGGRDGPRRSGPQADPKAAEAAEAARSFGHFPEEGEQLDARPGHLLVVCGDWLTHEDGSGGGGDMTTGDWKADSLPELVCEGLTSALEAISGRCVVVCTGGAGLSHAMVSRFVGSVGLDFCGPGRRRAPAVYTMRVYYACTMRV